MKVIWKVAKLNFQDGFSGHTYIYSTYKCCSHDQYTVMDVVLIPRPREHVLFQLNTSLLILEADPKLLYFFFMQDVGYPVWMLECWAPNIKPEEVGRRGRGQEEKEEVESVVTDGKEKERAPVFHQNRMWEVIVRETDRWPICTLRCELKWKFTSECQNTKQNHCFTGSISGANSAPAFNLRWLWNYVFICMYEFFFQ